MLAKEIEANFPKGVQLPKELKKLCKFADDNDPEVSGNFEFDTDGRDSAIAWFNGDDAVASHFAVFGRGPDGSVYAYWLHAGPDASKAPVVMLDSEGASASSVIASDTNEFLRLLAIGYDEPGRYPTLEPDNPDSADALRAWVEESLGLEVPEKGEEIVNAAKAKHPDLAAWLDARPRPGS